MSKDIHNEPFDEGTKAKLQIFNDYLRSWLPVFLAPKRSIWTSINIFDFFAGPGEDIVGCKGTPLRIVSEMGPYHREILSKGLIVNLYLNEFNAHKCLLLKKRVKQFQEMHQLPYQITMDSLNFKDAFDKYYNRMRTAKAANLILLDQSGVKHITNEVFQKIVTLSSTDFLFFISSSTIRRFADLPSIQQYINVTKEEVTVTDYNKIHKFVLEYYRDLLPKNQEYYLAPFSIKKGANIYGLIFGSGHILGIDKFLHVCWKIDPERGEANFDIDRDNILPGQLGLFTGDVQQPKKVDVFECELRKGIIQKEFENDEDIYLFTITNGFLPSHARKVIKSLIDEHKLGKRNFLLSSNVTKATTPKTRIELIEDGN